MPLQAARVSGELRLSLCFGLDFGLDLRVMKAALARVKAVVRGDGAGGLGELVLLERISRVSGLDEGNWAVRTVEAGVVRCPEGSWREG